VIFVVPDVGNLDGLAMSPDLVRRFRRPLSRGLAASNPPEHHSLLVPSLSVLLFVHVVMVLLRIQEPMRAMITGRGQVTDTERT